jgi:hypothetical protein
LTSFRSLPPQGGISIFIPISHKKGIILDLTDRIFSLSNPKFHHKKEVPSAVNISLNNCCLLSVIFSIMHQRPRFLFYNNRGNNLNLTTNIVDSDKKNTISDCSTKLTVHIKSIFRDFSSIVRSFNLKIACSIPNDLKQFIKTGINWMN